MTTNPQTRRFRMPFVPRTVRTLAPALATTVLGVLLLCTIYFTLLDWEWVTFLGGVLFAALLALVSRASHAEWIIARRTAQANQLRDRLAQESGARKRAEAACQVSDEKLRLVSDAMPTMLTYVDASQRYRFHNRAFREWIGLREPQIDGQLIGDVLGQSVYEEIQDKVIRAMAGERVNYERTQTMANGSVYRLNVIYLPHFDGLGKVIGYFGLLNDVTERIHLPVQSAPQNSAVAAEREEPAGQPLVVTSASGQTLYLNSMTEQLTGWSNPEARLRQALERDEFRLYCQHIAPAAIAVQPQPYYEILIRLQEEEDNLTPPGAFIPVAEHFNMTTELDYWVVRNVIAWHCRRRRNTPYWESSMYSINLFASTIGDAQFGAYVHELLAADKMPPQVLCFEIAEGEAVERLAVASRFVVELRRIGCRIALGGFGGGKVSFDTLKHLPVHFLKIDGSIIRDIESNPVNLAKIKAISRVSKVMGVKTIAQFVESREVRDKLIEFGIDYAQGFGIDRPQPIDKLP